MGDYRNFLKEREEVMDFYKRYTEAPIEEFLKKYKIKDNFFYEYKDCLRILEIQTTQPGIWIGKNGKRIDEFHKILKKEFRYRCESKL